MAPPGSAGSSGMHAQPGAANPRSARCAHPAARHGAAERRQQRAQQPGARRLPRLPPVRLGAGHPRPQQVRWGTWQHSPGPAGGFPNNPPRPCAPCRRIIKELKVNHEAQTSEALARNCLLIRELNTNIAAVRRAAAARRARVACVLSAPWVPCPLISLLWQLRLIATWHVLGCPHCSKRRRSWHPRWLAGHAGIHEHWRQL